MQTKINLAIASVLAVLACAASASEVYIDQAGSSTTIDITQTGNGNTVGSSGTPSTIIGDGSNIDIVQTGASNSADISTSVGTSGSVIDYSAAGNLNQLNVEIDGATDTNLTTTISGDSNVVVMCGTIATAGDASTTTAATCSAGVSADTTTTTIGITGSTNYIAIGADAASAINNITIGGTVASSFNTVNLSQTGTDTPVVTLNVDGNSNAINITQQ